MKYTNKINTYIKRHINTVTLSLSSWDMWCQFVERKEKNPLEKKRVLKQPLKIF